PAFLLGYALWNSSTAFVSGADSALLYDSLKADGRAVEASKQACRYAAINQASQGVASLVGAALATVDISLCFAICGFLGFAAAGLVLTIHAPPRTAEAGTEYRGYWRHLKRLMLAVALVPALLTPLLSARLNDLIPSAQRATILSLGALLFELGLAVAMPALLAFADRFGPAAAIGLSGLIFAVTTVPLMFVWRTADRSGVPASVLG